LYSQGAALRVHQPQAGCPRSHFTLNVLVRAGNGLLGSARGKRF
jgi:hypothetical protein